MLHKSNFAAGDGYDSTGRFNNVGWTAEGMSGNTTYA
jgi:hypothetical protein